MCSCSKRAGRPNPNGQVLALQQMFHTIEQNKEDILYKVTMSYIEVYNEQIRDLVNPDRGKCSGGARVLSGGTGVLSGGTGVLSGGAGVLDLREDPLRGSCVAGVSEHVAASTEEVRPRPLQHCVTALLLFNSTLWQVMGLLMRGNRNRATEATGANQVAQATLHTQHCTVTPGTVGHNVSCRGCARLTLMVCKASSRSHAVLQINVEQQDRLGNICAQVPCPTLGPTLRLSCASGQSGQALFD